MAIKINDFEKTSIFISIFALVIAAVSFYYSHKQNSENQSLSIINTRIQTCLGIASFHKDEQSSSEIVTDKNKFVSTVAERKDKAANLSRELTLCLAKSAGMNAVDICVKNANDNDAYKVHDNVSSSTDSGTKKGQDNLAC